jgi:hypothetical protein
MDMMIHQWNNKTLFHTQGLCKKFKMLIKAEQNPIEPLLSSNDQATTTTTAR